MTIRYSPDADDDYNRHAGLPEWVLDALEDALDLIEDHPSSAEARARRMTADGQVVWIVPVPPSTHPHLQIYWMVQDDAPIIIRILEP